jgi:BirA family biotin operon repressor/biotin-[acetyl-CoA-carboxylase] ligase
MAGLAVLEGIRVLTPLQPGLKWPNDVLLGTKKTAGILTEMATEGLRVTQVVIGIGLNVGQADEDFAPEIRPLATSLRLAGGRPVGRSEAAAALYNALDRWYGVFRSDGPEPILLAARAATVTLGKRVRVLGTESTWSGLALDLDEKGALLVEDETGTVRTVLADDVSIRDAG